MTPTADWTGRRISNCEPVSDRQLRHFRAVLAGMLAPLPVPPGFHWTLMPDVADPADLGRDGHPRQGLFVPEPGLPRRMWAGGEVRKTGFSGPLAFLSVHHRISVHGETCIEERQDLVYRADAKPGSPTATPAPAEDWPGAASWQITPDPTLLFRYSAITFNGHRIHYDHPYATGVEGYDGLVVHGPLQAIWMLNLATTILGQVPPVFAYRGVSPLICGNAVRVEAREQTGGLTLRVRRADGVVTMQASTMARP